MDIYKLLLQLKQDVLFKNTKSEISPGDLMRLRKFQINAAVGIPLIPGINKGHDFVSFYSAFFDSWTGFGDFDLFINDTFDPWLNYLIEENYEVSIKKIDSSEKVVMLDSDLLEKIEQLKQAYENKKYDEVTTKSNFILQQVFKDVCDKKGIKYNNGDNNSQLFDKFKAELKLDRDLYDGNESKFCSDFSGYIFSMVKTINNL